MVNYFNGNYNYMKTVIGVEVAVFGEEIDKHKRLSVTIWHCCDRAIYLSFPSI